MNSQKIAGILGTIIALLVMAASSSTGRDRVPQSGHDDRGAEGPGPDGAGAQGASSP